MAQLERTNASLEFAEAEPGHLRVILAGEYDIATIPGVHLRLEELLSHSAEVVVVDLAELSFMDSSGVAILLRIANHFGPIEVANASPIICRMIQGLGLSGVLRMPTA
jgi:anti-anti-sigma factor